MITLIQSILRWILIQIATFILFLTRLSHHIFETFSTSASPGVFSQLSASSPYGDKVRTDRFSYRVV